MVSPRIGGQVHHEYGDPYATGMVGAGISYRGKTQLYSLRIMLISTRKIRSCLVGRFCMKINGGYYITELELDLTSEMFSEISLRIMK